MKKKFFLAFLLFVACSEKQTETSLSPKDFDAKLKSTRSAILIDVRTKAEVEEGALPNARNIVYDDSFADRLKVGPLDAPVFVYCAAGKRSEKAANIMKGKGYREVYQLKGGLNAWKEAKMPL